MDSLTRQYQLVQYIKSNVALRGGALIMSYCDECLKSLDDIITERNVLIGGTYKSGRQLVINAYNQAQRAIPQPTYPEGATTKTKALIDLSYNNKLATEMFNQTKPLLKSRNLTDSKGVIFKEPPYAYQNGESLGILDQLSYQFAESCLTSFNKRLIIKDHTESTLKQFKIIEQNNRVNNNLKGLLTSIEPITKTIDKQVTARNYEAAKAATRFGTTNNLFPASSTPMDSTINSSVNEFETPYKEASQLEMTPAKQNGYR